MRSGQIPAAYQHCRRSHDDGLMRTIDYNMKKTIKHYYPFGNIPKRFGDTLLSPQAWDAVRANSAQKPFYLPATRHEWLEKCDQQTDVILRSHDAIKILAGLGVNRIFSVGVGCGWLEYHMKLLSKDHLSIVCADYAPDTVARLKIVSMEFDDIVEFDMSINEWPNGYDLFLLHRVDMEIDNRMWMKAFERMSKSDAKYVLFIPCGLLTLRTLASELALRARALALGQRAVFCGYWRTREMFGALWRPHYYERRAAVIGDLPGFVLERVQPGHGHAARSSL
jgi:hypothetical protein